MSQDDQGVLLQIFTKPLVSIIIHGVYFHTYYLHVPCSYYDNQADRPTIFIEIIQVQIVYFRIHADHIHITMTHFLVCLFYLYYVFHSFKYSHIHSIHTHTYIHTRTYIKIYIHIHA